MPETEEFIHLLAEDDFPVIRRRLAQAQAAKVYLIVPTGCVGLKNEVRLRLLSRLLGDAPYRLALVTSDLSLINHAQRLGISAFLSVEEARTAPPQKWTRPQLPSRPAPGGRRLVAAAVAAPQRGEVILLLSLATGLALLGFLGAVLFLPGAEVNIHPLTSPIEGSFTIVVDPRASEIHEEDLTLPGQVMDLELLGKEGMPTTARKDLPDAPAEGEVLFVNLTSDPVFIPQGTVVSTTAGTYIRFHTLTEASLSPGYGQQVRLPIAAVEPGPSGNVPALAINRVEGVLGFQLRVINEHPAEGGTAKQVPYVTLEDKNILKGRLMQRLWQEGFNSLSSQLSGQLLLPGFPELIVLSEIYDHAVGDEAGALNLELRVLARGIIVRESDLVALALSTLQARAGPGIQLLPQGLEFALGQPSEGEQGKIILPITFRARSMPRLDEGAIKGGLAGKTIPQALDYLQGEIPLAREAVVKLTPAGWPLLPWLPARIQIAIIPGGE